MAAFDTVWHDVFTQPDVLGAYRRYGEGWDERIGAFLEFDPGRIPPRELTDGQLAGVPFAVKDNIAVAGFNLTCGSEMLRGLSAPYTATAVQRLIDAGAVPVGKTNLDEFGMGSSTDNSALAVTSNPWNPDYVAGGSSGGSAAAVAAGVVPFAIGSDTGGSIRQPAAFCGVIGLKPTYGTVSRYGLVAYASSLEVIGVLSRSVAVAREVFHVMRGMDSMDHSSVAAPEEPPSEHAQSIGFLPSLPDLRPEIAAAYEQTMERLGDLGYEIVQIELPELEYVVPAYYTIATAEASANLSRFNGIRYGHRTDWAENPDELVRKSRNEGFGPEVKLRVLLGTYVLRSGFQDRYYIRAQKIRTAIRNGFDSAFQRVDAVCTPVFPTQAFRHGSEEMDPFQQKLADKFTSAANLAGIPGLAFPTGVVNGLPMGMQLLAPAFCEERLFRIAGQFEKQFPPATPEGYTLHWS